MKLFCDNKATISIANNLIQHDKTKHVEIDTLSKRNLTVVASAFLTYLQANKLLIFSQKDFSYKASSLVLASWVFLTFTVQLEGEC